jgi:hypothetical protein
MLQLRGGSLSSDAVRFGDGDPHDPSFENFRETRAAARRTFTARLRPTVPRG